MTQVVEAVFGATTHTEFVDALGSPLVPSGYGWPVQMDIVYVDVDDDEALSALYFPAVACNTTIPHLHCGCDACEESCKRDVSVRIARVGDVYIAVLSCVGRCNAIPLLPVRMATPVVPTTLVDVREQRESE